MSDNELKVTVGFDVALYEPYLIDSEEWKETDYNFIEGRIKRFEKYEIKKNYKAKHIINLMKKKCNFDKFKDVYLEYVEFSDMVEQFEAKLLFKFPETINYEDYNIINDVVMEQIWPGPEDGIQIKINGKIYEVDMLIDHIYVSINGRTICYYYN